MATTATTPNPPGRHTSLLIGNNQRKHSVRTGNRSLDPQADRPNAPVFLEEPLFLQGLSHGTAVAGGSRSTATGSRASLQQLGMDVLRDEVQGGSTNKSKKRTAGEVLDLTNTTTNSPEQDNPIVGPSGRQVKKPRMPWDEIAEKKAEMLANRQKQQKKREREQRQEKLAQESAMWRAKYKKAFPSFTFYFDTIDEATKAQLGIQVKKLGAVRSSCFSLRPRTSLTTVESGERTVRRSILQQKSHSRRHFSITPYPIQQGEHRLSRVVDKQVWRSSRIGSRKDEETFCAKSEIVLSPQRSKASTVRSLSHSISR